MDTQDFINRSNETHCNKYNYKSVVYKNTKTKVIIICEQHGEFQQTPAEHLRGNGCRQCFYDSLHSTLAQFIVKARLIHSDTYSYDKVFYKSARTPVTIICKTHGDFEQMPYIHISGSGCPICYKDTQINSTNKFIAKAREIHGDRYDYCDSEYINDQTKIAITCKAHGTFYQRKKNHLDGSGCHECAKQSRLILQNDFINRSQAIHADLYNYDSANYKGSFDSITITCPIHGNFEQLPSNHLQGAGCKFCAIGKTRSNTDDFILKASLVHHNKYDYTESVYTTALDKIKIICPNHGEFQQKSNNHLQGQGCPSCPTSTSVEQQQIGDYISTTLKQTVTINDRVVLSPKEIDILIKSANLGIEYHGLYWHSYNFKETKEQINRHQDKALSAKSRGIRLLQFFEHEWAVKPHIIQSIIKHHLKLSEKLNARDLKITTDIIPYDFYAQNHLQGSRYSSHHLCLTNNNNEIIMAASFSKHKDGYELIRMATKNNFCVRGGVSKIMAHYKKLLGNKQLLTFADFRYASASGYLAANFKLLNITKPGYFYYHNRSKIILSRQQCQKHKLVNLLPLFDDKLTEYDNMFVNGYRRVWDAGHIKLVLPSF